MLTGYERLGAYLITMTAPLIRSNAKQPVPVSGITPQRYQRRETDDERNRGDQPSRQLHRNVRRRRQARFS
jgi:hypothetical protein